MKKISIISIAIIFILSIPVSPIKAYNYNPGVKVGDELIWSHMYNGADQPNIKHEITEIVDEGSNTEIKGYYSVGNDNDFTTYTYPATIVVLGTLKNYTENPEAFFNSVYITNKTKLSDYIDLLEEIEFLGPNTTYESFYYGYGLNCTEEDGDRTIIRFNADGILTFKELNNGVDIYELESINGSAYHIMGVKFSVIGICVQIVAIAIITRRKIRKNKG